MYDDLYIQSFKFDRQTIPKYIVGCLSFCAVLVTYQINVTSRHYVAAFGIQNYNIGIYLSKLISFRTLLMVVGFLIQFCVQRYIVFNNIMEYGILISMCLMTVSRLIFLIFLYIPSSLSLQAYLILNAEALYSGYFQMSLLTSFPEYSSITTLSMVGLGIFVYLFQISLECLPYSNPLLIIKFQCWICVIISLGSIGLWVFYTFYFNQFFPRQFEEIKDEQFYFDDLSRFFVHLQYHIDEETYNKFDNINKKINTISDIIPKIKQSHTVIKELMNLNLSNKILEKQKSNQANILDDIRYILQKSNTIMKLINDLNTIDGQRTKEISKILKIILEKIKEVQRQDILEIKKTELLEKLKVNQETYRLEIKNLEKIKIKSYKNDIEEIKDLSQIMDNPEDVDIISIIFRIGSDISKIKQCLNESDSSIRSSVKEDDNQDNWDASYSISYIETDSDELEESLNKLKKIKDSLEKKRDEELKKIKLNLLISNLDNLKKYLDQLSNIFRENKDDSQSTKEIFINEKNRILSLLLLIEESINNHLPQVNFLKECKTVFLNYLIKELNNIISNINKTQEEITKSLTTKVKTGLKGLNSLDFQLTNKLDQLNKNDGKKISEISEVFKDIDRKIDYILSKKGFLKENTQNFGLFKNLTDVLSPFMMVIAASAIKDFLHPGILPYALLDRDDCHFINLIIPLIQVLGSCTVFCIDYFLTGFRDWPWCCNLVWILMMPQLGVWMSTLLAIHTKEGFFKLIIDSTLTVLLMSVVLLYCYSLMESMSYVGVANYVFYKSDRILDSLNIIIFHNILSVFCHYFFSKFSIGYNATRVGIGIIYPAFQPIHNMDYNFCYWIIETLRNAFRDIFLDFKLNIRDYT